MQSFHSALSYDDDKNVPSVQTFEPTYVDVDDFYLDVAKLEKVACIANDGISCRVRRCANTFENDSYFRFRVEYRDGKIWDVIIPHSHLSNTNPETLDASEIEGMFDAKKDEERTPVILSWSTSMTNEAGVPYFLIEDISGNQASMLSLTCRIWAMEQWRLDSFCESQSRLSIWNHLHAFVDTLFLGLNCTSN